MSKLMTDARKVLLQNGYSLVKEGYEDVSATQMSGMKERLTKYIETKSEFKIKSKSNPLGLVVTVEKEGDGLALFNANTGVELAYTKDIDQMIKAIFDIQKHLEAYQKEESIILDMPREINDGFKKYEYVIIPDTEPFNSGKPKDQPYCHMATVYLHGQAEDDAGFDITFIIPKDGNEKVKLGKTKVGIITLQGLKEGIMYTWVDPMFSKHTKGLIVYPEDTKAKAYAEKTFANPPLNI